MEGEVRRKVIIPYLSMGDSRTIPDEISDPPPLVV